MNKQTMGVALGAVGGFVACWLVVGMAGCGKGGDIIASVNGEAITVDEYYKYLEFKPDVRVVTNSGVASLPPEGTLGFQAMQDLIAQRVTIQLAKDKKLFPSEADINKELEFKKKLNPNFLPQLTARGYTFDLIRQSITLDIIRERLLTSGITISPSEVDQYVKDNPTEFIEPERAELMWILAKDKNTQRKVDDELNAGQSFSQVALRYSEAPDAKQTNGRLLDKSSGGPVAIRDLPADIAGAIKPKKDGQSTDWIRLIDGWAKFLIAKRIPERPIVLDDTKKEYLRRLLAQKKGSEARDINRQVLSKLKDSKVDIRRTSFQEPWKQAYRKFMTESKLESLTGKGTE